MCKRCGWVFDSEEMLRYHDERWCKPVHEDAELYAMLVLEGMQAGLSWSLIIKRETQIRSAFDGLDPNRVAAYDEREEARLLTAPGVIHNRSKIHAAVTNARAFQKVQQEFGSFDAYLWSFVDGTPIDHQLKRVEDMPAENDLSRQVSKDLKKRGFRFVGPTTVYSYLQGVGLFNDHVMDCEYR